MTVTTAPAAPVTSGQQTQSLSSTAAEQRFNNQRPNVEGYSNDQPSYVLSLWTDRAHNDSMNSLRKTYFPPKLNKIPAHITLFHALPGSKLESDVLPAIRHIASRTPPYRVRATNPMRLSHGVGIKVADDIDHANDSTRGRNMTRIVHAELRKKWGEWLSEQDSTPPRFHYTVMNKVNNERVVEQALAQLEESFKRGEDVSGGKFDHSGKNNDRLDEEGEGTDRHQKLAFVGEVQGLILWRYERSGHWADPEQFKFTGRDR
ncbi:hypothetical protein OHC33_006313 [Knufia fluminis]|uniref:Uncharacterized protein n=1 Tax=Knufia fluminis TaxID=191047 RepID=A0AAN8F7B4_9EURO|nr:hypothetical protein OHC33_006313 [Knufia fluminis]